jgi:hypothetical protein
MIDLQPLTSPAPWWPTTIATLASRALTLDISHHFPQFSALFKKIDV